jgi:YidC/Oxa1 family membrane protein insertase
MDIKRVVLGAALAMLAYALWTSWQVDYPKQALTSAHVSQTMGATRTEGALLPAIGGPESESGTTRTSESTMAMPHVESEDAVTPSIQVKTDVLDISIDLAQGDVIGAELLDYSESVKLKDKPFVLLKNKESSRYVANSSLLIKKQGMIEAVNPQFKAAHTTYTLEPHQDELVVTLTGTNDAGLAIKKIFTFKRGNYLIDVRYALTNEGREAWTGYMNTQLLRDLPKEDKSTPFHIGSYTGASYSNPGHHRYQKVTFKDMAKAPLNVDVEGGWLAMQQHYFLTAWIPLADKMERFYTRTVNGRYAIGAVSQAIKLLPGHTETVGSQLYLGPEVADKLKIIAPSLDLTIDYGWLWFISSLIFSVMKIIYSVVGNWGWSIVLVTVLIKLAFYRLSATSYRSMAGMRQLQPKLQALRERYGDDKAKISQATMELYRQEKVNPLSGCLPMVIQIPVFIALYWVLVESVELRQAPFIFWIQDLASSDPWHVLPLIMGTTMLIQQRLNPAPPDPMQAKLMMFLPVLFTALFWNFPSGLVLYWTVNNTLTILQQWYITRQYSAAQ